MTESPVLAALVSVPAAVAVLVLPGFGVRLLGRLALRSLGRSAADRNTRPVTPLVADVVLSVAWSTIFVTFAGGAMLAARVFSAPAIAGVTAVAAAAGIWPFLRWCARAVRWTPYAVLVAGIAMPLVATAFRPGYRPASTYQWFYWQLGAQLSSAHGVPQYVLEWGQRVRWLPDYLTYNVITQAYLGTLHGVPATSALDAMKLPIALLVVAMTFLVFRLWFSGFASAGATVAVSASTLYLQKVGNDTPESLAIGLGLGCVWLAVSAIRVRRPQWLLLSGVLIGLTATTHAIAAAITGLLMAVAVLVETGGCRGVRARWLATAAVALLACVGVIVAVGLALQGRASPLGAASNPSLVGGTDPTYVFVERSEGYFNAGATANGQELPIGVAEPWSGVNLAAPGWWWLAIVMAVGLAAALLLGPRPARRGALVALLFGGILACAGLWFALRYNTYVPQHTGNSRIAQYAPVLYAMGIAAVLELPAAGLLVLLPRQWTALAVVGVTGLGLAWSAPSTIEHGRETPQLDAASVRALMVFRSRAGPGPVVVSNAATRGLIEFFTDAEDPLEGRQPFIENARVLATANDYLERMHEFLLHPAPGQLQRGLHANWLILTDNPRRFGAIKTTYGTPAANFAARAGLQLVWQRGDVRLLRAPGRSAPVRSVGPPRWLLPRFAAAAFLVVLALALFWWAVARLWLGRSAYGARRRGRHAVQRHRAPPRRVRSHRVERPWLAEQQGPP